VNLVLVAPAKLTLSLRITDVRDDGLHVLDAEMVSLDLVDRLTIGAGSGLEIYGTEGGLEVAADDGNLVSRALTLVGRDASVVIEKEIPAGAGLGGGSADAAAILRWAGFRDLIAASRIGADVAYCVVGGHARVSGIGEVVEPLPFEERVFTLLIPPVGCPTGAVYQRWDELGGPTGEVGNDLEPALLDLAPEVARWRDSLGDATGIRPRLAGSGGTWFVEGEYPGDGRRVVRTVPPSMSPV
jgi:4-diphosphocytidyl-2-C-methyl-D-erythritol kinase|tara:strand:- start:252 stop:977 length:726 start_codon:yes stop_codon:yes gene_type:complete